MCKRSYPRLSAPASGLRSRVIACLLLAAALATGVAAARWSRPVDLPDPGQARLPCLSYAPWNRHGESPIDDDPISAQRIADDLRLLSRYTKCVRTYSSRLGLGEVPRIASQLGMTVLQGIWIGRDPVANAAEIEAGLAAVAAAPDSVRGLVVGNEVLLRREQPAASLAGLLASVRARAPVPVTYADVWEFWIRHPELAGEVDWITIHALPYWEDHPVGVEEASAHIQDVHRLVSERFPGKEILIGETGWPSAGRQRGPAAPGRIAQARFTRDWMRTAGQAGIDYNYIEAFDQPWKRRLEGAMGGAWGIVGSDGQVKFPFQGPVAEAPERAGRMTAGLVAGLLLGLALALWPLLRGRPRPSPAGWLAGAGGLALIGGLMPWQLETLATWSRTPLEWLAAGGFALLGNLLLALLSGWLALAAVGAAGPPRAAITASVAALVFGAAYFAGLHAVDPRYRGFPTALYVAPALALVVLRVAWPAQAMLATHARWLAWLAGAGALFMLWRAWPENHQAIVFSLLPLAMAACVLSQTTTGEARPTTP